VVIPRVIDRLVAFVAFLPVGLQRLVAAAFAVRRGAVVPLVAFGLVLLGLFPLAQAGVELITHQATPGDVIERRAGDLTMLEVAGIGYETGLSAGTDATGHPVRWLALRDGVDDRRVMLVRTPVDDGTLRIRDVVGRVTSDAPLVASATNELATRGAAGFGDPTNVAALDGRMVVEVRSGVDPNDAQRIEDPAAIAGMADGTLVRLRLRFTGAGIATCTLDANCEARRLAVGAGEWVLDAVGLHSTQRVLVKSPLPPSAVPVTFVGRQVRDPAAVDAMLATGPGRALLGWSRALDVALLDHDPALPADRAWGGALLLVVLGLLLLLGRRIRYPVFRHEGAITRRFGGAPAVAGVASGRLGVPDGAPLDVVDLPIRLEPQPDAGPALVAELPAGHVRVDVPRASATASGIEVGRLAFVRRSIPALWLSWFGTDLRVAFAGETERDAAAALLVSVPVRPAAASAPPPPRPRPRRTTQADEPDPPPWRRPRPPGVR
jgi:hypothetical protein